jgi:hypothetical protein
MLFYVIPVLGVLYVVYGDRDVVNRVRNRMLWMCGYLYANVRSSNWFHSISQLLNGGRQRELPLTERRRIHPPQFDFSMALPDLQNFLT